MVFRSGPDPRTFGGAVAAAGMAATLALSAVGCSAGAPQSAATVVSTPPYSGPTGSELATIMLTAADLPAGYTDTNGGVTDSGQTRATATLTANPTSSDCNALLNTLGGTSMGEAAYAYDAYSPASGTGEFTETVLEFPAGQATALMNRFGAALNGCGTFQAREENGAMDTAKTLLEPGPKVGDESFGYRVDVAIGAANLVNAGVVVRVGDALVILANSGVTTPNAGASAIDLAALSATLAQRLSTLR